MQLVRHGEQIVAIIERGWEKAYLTAQQGRQQWVPLFPIGLAIAIAEIDPLTRQVRLCAGQAIANQQEVVFHDD